MWDPFEFIKKHRRAAILLAALAMLLLALGVPFVVNLLFKVGSGSGFLHAEWDAGDALAYCGTVLTFSSTVALSVLALWQSHTISEQTRRREEAIERLEEERRKPRFIITGVVGHNRMQDLIFSIRNISENPIYKAFLSDFRAEGGGRVIWSPADKTVTFDCIFLGEPAEVKLGNPPLDGYSSLSFTITLLNQYGTAYRYRVVGTPVGSACLPRFEITQEP